MRSIEEINEQLWFAHTYGVLGRDFQGCSDLEPMGDDWKAWIIGELRRNELNLVQDGDHWLGRATEPVTYPGGTTVGIGDPIVQIGFTTAEELTALYADLSKPDPVQREHPWYRVKDYRGYVTLRRLEDVPEAFRYGHALDERSWGRTFLPFADGYADPLVPWTHPLTDLLYETSGFCVRYPRGSDPLEPIWNPSDARRFFAPIVDEINTILPGLGIGPRARAMNWSDGCPDRMSPVHIGQIDDPVLDLNGRPIAHPEKLLARASIELWHLRHGPFNVADSSRPKPDEEERRRAAHARWIGWELLSRLNTMGSRSFEVVFIGLVFVILLAIAWCRA